MSANVSRDTSAHPSKDEPTCRGREVRKDPQDDTDAQTSKAVRQDHNGPTDDRNERALQYVLHYAPPETDWGRIWDVYSSGQDPREVWGNE